MAEEAITRLQLNIQHLTAPHHTLYVIGAERVTSARQQAKLMRPFNDLTEV